MNAGKPTQENQHRKFNTGKPTQEIQCKKFNAKNSNERREPRNIVPGFFSFNPVYISKSSIHLLIQYMIPVIYVHSIYLYTKYIIHTISYHYILLLKYVVYKIHNLITEVCWHLLCLIIWSTLNAEVELDLRLCTWWSYNKPRIIF